MMEQEKINLPHHEQMSLCSTRLRYRQGRKLTAVKVYTVNNESKHLLVFGVPSLNLRQETKALFSRFGKLKQFAITDKYTNELFTETYHVIYERTQSARIAKKILDTKNFYGGSLHICYAPELESIDETRQKLMQRKKEVLQRLKANAEKPIEKLKVLPIEKNIIKPKSTVNMGEFNTIVVGTSEHGGSLKRKHNDTSHTNIKQFKSCFIEKGFQPKDPSRTFQYSDDNIASVENSNNIIPLVESLNSAEDTLNYNNFGNEIVKCVNNKPINKIKFFVKNNKL